MKRLAIVALALWALPAAANYYGGVRLSELVQQSQDKPTVLAQADSIDALQQQLAAQGEAVADINSLISDSPTAAGGTEGPRIEARTVVDRCYFSYQATACSTKVVYQLVE
ncbi:hypothetical protein [Ferrimonas balearica]|uniref:hypothetical protein n=1 Tax=Ferrimonas balearica TaxID=44012 RepID=UPI001C56243A|nr:hypothetical protein [Ferrimonas balearica]MBW3140817.1 hypothetical protein [Ferrimonas balearica]MBY6107379.1 hypothetical protein [Ferrimonas balearica]MBY6225860.1 hypothetical protein [Ferrimonas balearica]